MRNVKSQRGYALAYVLIDIMILTIVIGNIYAVVTSNYTAAIRAAKNLEYRAAAEGRATELIEMAKDGTNQGNDTPLPKYTDYSSARQNAFIDCLVRTSIFDPDYEYKGDINYKETGGYPLTERYIYESVSVLDSMTDADRDLGKITGASQEEKATAFFNKQTLPALPPFITEDYEKETVVSVPVYIRRPGETAGGLGIKMTVGLKLKWTIRVHSENGTYYTCSCDCTEISVQSFSIEDIA